MVNLNPVSRTTVSLEQFATWMGLKNLVGWLIGFSIPLNKFAVFFDDLLGKESQSECLERSRQLGPNWTLDPSIMARCFLAGPLCVVEGEEVGEADESVILMFRTPRTPETSQKKCKFFDYC
ncbi:hypothetical protein B9Z55_023121 [Caenorhabditis nigoni]|uniref:Uncharacterized protein n=1 Tax=Caenorhabditis nigoni TaxID=1611254 RepID=A0A2G5SNV8_9PELO|nr:hypothetical protein B9Z55_023121 [Caenorhabditis nigoni]